MTYPQWSYFPRNQRPPEWALSLTRIVMESRQLIDTLPLPLEDAERVTSDRVLSILRPSMEAYGYTVESGKQAHQRIERPVLFGDNGVPSVKYEIDAFHDEIGIAVEVEAGRGAQSNAGYRDIVRTSLLLDARYMALMVPIKYRYSSGGRALTEEAYAKTREQLSAIYASQRLRLPFEGVLLIGY